MTGVVVDTSAVFAILADEPNADELSGLLSEADVRLLSAATLVELGIVLESRLGPAGHGTMAQFLDAAEMDIVAVDARLAGLALEGWRRFGKGRHPAKLNFGDCFTYALAIERTLPVLCTGEDFSLTDVTVMRPS
ncbi:MAG: type II toxin-antitoxin system VapC family toxin [Acidimicrobiia bacterium]